MSSSEVLSAEILAASEAVPVPGSTFEGINTIGPTGEGLNRRRITRYMYGKMNVMVAMTIDVRNPWYSVSHIALLPTAALLNQVAISVRVT